MLFLSTKSIWTFSYKDFNQLIMNTVKPVLRGHLKKDKSKALMANSSLMKVESIYCNILQYFKTVLRDNQF